MTPHLGKLTAQFISSSMAATLNLNPLDKQDWLEDDLCDLGVSSPPQDLVISSAPVLPLKQKQDFSDPVPKRKPTLNPDKENHDPAKTSTRPDTCVRRVPEPCPLPNSFHEKRLVQLNREIC